MNILSIGNSFSCDAQRYLHGIAAADGYALNCFNLYIGGCPLAAHFRNLHSDRPAYTLEMNGVSTGFPVSIKEALLNREWDVVTLQQASHDSCNYETYQPYLSVLADAVRTYAPHARLVIHQTWAYEDGSERLQLKMGYGSADEMRRDAVACYTRAARECNADLTIPSGELFGDLLAAGIERIHRDTYHASRGLGRYALGLLWYAVLTGRSVIGNSFSAFDEEIPAEEIAIAQKAVEARAAQVNA